jgi:hypothetical protein
LRRAEQHKASGQQNRSGREIHLRGLLSPCDGEPARSGVPSPAQTLAIDIPLMILPPQTARMALQAKDVFSRLP